MPDFIAGIGSAVGAFFGSPVVQFVLYSILAYLVVLWLASAYWVFRDMQQRTENAILPYLAASLVIVFLPVFPLAVFVYKIIRPHEKIGEVYERNLAEEALLAEVEAIKSCPTCARRVNDEWIICPTCRTRLNRVCPNCSRLVGLDWSLCAWCGKDFERPGTAIGPSAGRPAAISPLPAADEAGRIGRSGPPVEVESDRPAVANATQAASIAMPAVASATPRPRASSPRTSSPRTAPDGLTDA